MEMYFVPEGTKKCGFYECSGCKYRFLSLYMMERIPCPLCGNSVDYEIGPDEEMEEVTDTAKLLEIVEGEENVMMMDKLLSVAYDEDESWI